MLAARSRRSRAYRAAARRVALVAAAATGPVLGSAVRGWPAVTLAARPDHRRRCDQSARARCERALYPRLALPRRDRAGLPTLPPLYVPVLRPAVVGAAALFCPHAISIFSDDA